MKVCTNCGKKMDSDATFCIECGTHNLGEYKSGSGSDRVPFTFQKEKILPLVAFAVSFMFSFPGLILSIIALIYSKKHDDVGKGLAVAGIITSATRLSYLLALLIVSLIRK